MTDGIVRYGIHKTLDDAATELIRQSLVGVTSMAEKSDILTPWKEQDRKTREILVRDGVPDASTRQGMYHRAWNSQHAHLNSRDGIARGSRFGSLKNFVDSHGDRNAEFGDDLTSHLGEAGFD